MEIYGGRGFVWRLRRLPNPLPKDKMLTVISNKVRNLIFFKNLEFYRTIVYYDSEKKFKSDNAL